MYSLNDKRLYPDYWLNIDTWEKSDYIVNKLSGQDENLVFLAILNWERQSIIDEFIAKKEKWNNELWQINKENHTTNSLDENIEIYRAMVWLNLMWYNRNYDYETSW
jgi:hypothetical protein